MSEFDPMDTTGQADAGAVYSDDVDAYGSDTETAASYEETASDLTEVTSTYEDTTYEDTTYEAESYDTTSTPTDATVGTTEVSNFQPYANSDNRPLSVDELVTTPAPATTAPAEVSNFQPYANSDNRPLSVDELVTNPAPATDALAQQPYDAFTTSDLESWQSAYDQWNSVVTNTGHAPVASDPALDLETTSMVGEPGDASFWFQQKSQFTCGPSVATQIISDFTGNVELDETEAWNYAASKNWLVDEDNDGDYDGMYPKDIAQLLTDHGVPSTLESNQTVDDLVRYLSEGKAVVLSLDNENLPGMQELDGLEGNGLLAVNPNQQDDSNHVVRLIGIDTERGMAYLSDPGRADGKNLAVPLEMLKEAWNDSGNLAIVSAAGDPTPDQPATTTPQPGGPETPEPGPETPGPGAIETPSAPAPAPQADVEPAPAPTAQARPASAQASNPSVVRTETVTTSTTPPADVAPLDLGVSDQINDMLQTAADAAAPPVDLTTPSSQPDGLFDSALGFVLIPVAVSAGVAGTLGYRQLRSNR